jgi:hypothetical protein
MLIYGENRNGNPVQYEVIDNYQECDIECQIHIEDVDKDRCLLYLIGSQRNAEIISEGRVRIC